MRGEKITYAGADGDAFVLMLPATLGRRMLWTTFGRGGASDVLGVAMAGGIAAVAARQPQAPAARQLVTYEALHPQAGPGPSDAWFAVWPAP